MTTKTELLEVIVGRLDDIHDALTAKPCDCARQDAYAAREAEQRRVPTLIADLAANADMTPERVFDLLDAIATRIDPDVASSGPLAFAPDAAQEATGGDLSASEGESGAAAGGDTVDAQKAILCPECWHYIDEHGWEADYAITCCLACDDPADCRKSPSDIARALIERAVEQAGGGRG